MKDIIKKINQLFENGDFKESTEFALNYLLENPINQNNVTIHITIYNDLTKFYFLNKDAKTALKYAKKGIEIAQSFNVSNLLASQYLRIGNIYAKFHVNDQALSYFKTSVEYATDKQDLHIYQSSVFNMASLYYAEGSIKEALNTLKLLLKQTYYRNEKLKAYVHLLASDCYAKLRNYSKAIECLNSGLSFYDFKNEERLTEKLKLPLYYIYSNSEKKAKIILSELERDCYIFENNNEFLRDYHFALGIYFNFKKEYENAISALQKTIKFSFSENHFDAFSVLISCYHKVGLHEEAIRLSDQYINKTNRYYEKERAKRHLRMSTFLELDYAEIEADKTKKIYNQEKKYRNWIETEKGNFDKLLANILPTQAIKELKEKEFVQPKKYDEASVLFAELTNFEELTKSLNTDEVVGLLNEVISNFDKLALQYKIERIKTIGNGYMAVSGVPVPNKDHLPRIANFALELMESIKKLNSIKGYELELQVGLSTGALIAGVVGQKKFAYDIWGDTVNMASRMNSQSLEGKIQCTKEVYEKLKEKYSFTKRGKVNIKGKGVMETWFLIRSLY